MYLKLEVEFYQWKEKQNCNQKLRSKTKKKVQFTTLFTCKLINYRKKNIDQLLFFPI